MLSFQAPATAEATGIETTFVEAGGVRLAALVAGRGPSTVVLLHGASGNARDWSFGALQALARDHRVIAFDRPGLGLSDAPAEGGASLAVQARLMAEATARLGAERPLLVGHSYGGAVALAWALDRPEAVRGLVLIAAPSQVWEGGVGVVNDLLAAPLAGALVAATAPRLMPAGFPARAAARIFAPQAPPAGYLERLGLDLLLRPATLRTNARHLTALKAHIRAMVPRYPALDLPVALLHGDRDEVVPLAVHSIPLARALPRAELAVLPGIGHMPHHAEPGRLAAAVAALAARA